MNCHQTKDTLTFLILYQPLRRKSQNTLETSVVEKVIWLRIIHNKSRTTSNILQRLDYEVSSLVKLECSHYYSEIILYQSRSCRQIVYNVKIGSKKTVVYNRSRTRSNQRQYKLCYVAKWNIALKKSCKFLQQKINLDKVAIVCMQLICNGRISRYYHHHRRLVSDYTQRNNQTVNIQL